MAGVSFVAVIINLVALQSCISVGYGKDSYAKDFIVAKSEKCKWMLINAT